MKASCTGRAELRIVSTGEVFQVRPEDVDWEQDGGEERSMGAELRYVATFEFSSSKTGQHYEATWELWEYPIGVQNHSNTQVTDGVEVIKDFEYGLSHEPEDE